MIMISIHNVCSKFCCFRYYYNKRILNKTKGKRFTYKFNFSKLILVNYPGTDLKYVPPFIPQSRGGIGSSSEDPNMDEEPSTPSHLTKEGGSCSDSGESLDGDEKQGSRRHRSHSLGDTDPTSTMTVHPPTPTHHALPPGFSEHQQRLAGLMSPNLRHNYSGPAFQVNTYSCSIVFPFFLSSVSVGMNPLLYPTHWPEITKEVC